MLISDLVSTYLTYIRERVRPNTYAGYESAMRCHVLPRWGALELEYVRREDIQDWVSQMTYGAARKAFKTLRQVVRWAMREYRLRIPYELDAIALPDAPIKPERVLTESELRRCVIGWQGQDWEPVALCLASLGLRPCEALALRWADIDLKNGEVRIDKGRHEVGGRVMVWGTKTAKSRRTLVLPRFALIRLKEIKRERCPHLTELLCSARPSSILHRLRAWFYRNGFEMCAEKLRHTWATLAIAAGVPIEVAAMAMGHTGVEICYTRYLARSTRVLKEAQRKIEALIIGSVRRVPV